MPRTRITFEMDVPEDPIERGRIIGAIQRREPRIGPISSATEITVGDVSRWQDHRLFDQAGKPHSPFDLGHQVAHIVKALGPIAANAEHRDHGEPDVPFEDKRAADLIIHAIWAVRAAGLDPEAVVSARIRSFQDGFFP